MAAVAAVSTRKKYANVMKIEDFSGWYASAQAFANLMRIA